MFNRFQTRQDLIPNPNPNIMRTIIRKLPPLRTKGCFAPQVVFETMIFTQKHTYALFKLFLQPYMWSPLDSLTIRLKTPLWYFEDFLNPTFIEFSRVKLLIDTRCKPKTVTTLFNCPSVCPVFWGFLKKFFYFNVYLVFAGINQRNSFVINRLITSYHQRGLGHGFVCYLLKEMFCNFI